MCVFHECNYQRTKSREKDGRWTKQGHSRPRCRSRREVAGRCRLTHDHHLVHVPLTVLSPSPLSRPVLVDVGQSTAASTTGVVKFPPWICRSGRLALLILESSQRVLCISDRSASTHRSSQSSQWPSWGKRSSRKTICERPRWHSNGLCRRTAQRTLGIQGETS